MAGTGALEEDIVIQAQGVYKSFPGVLALQHLDFAIRRGEVHALVGQNGAGKSTLVKIIVREYQEDEGAIFVEGHNVRHMAIRDVQQLGLSLIHQDLNLVPIFTVAHNICLGVEPVTRFGTLDWKAMRDKAAPYLAELSSDIDPETRVEDLSISQQQLVTVARALVSHPKILILDEPTARLDQHSTDALFSFLERFKKKGRTILYISHRLEEIYRICDRITVLRDGRNVATAKVGDLPRAELVRKMVGRELKQQVPKQAATIGERLLSVRNLNPPTGAQDVSFDLRAGEILGIVGSIGAGKSEVARTLFGADRKKSGHITVQGKPVDIREPHHAITAGIALVPEERRKQGLVGNESIRKNLTLVSLRKKFCRLALWLDQKREKQVTDSLIHTLNMATPSGEQETQLLSGGTQQKVVVGKWLISDSKVYIFDEPTKGIDVGGKHDIYKLIVELAKKQAGVIFISNELDEVLALCDRTLVMFGGRVVKELVNKETTKEDILYYVMGGKENGNTNG